LALATIQPVRESRKNAPRTRPAGTFRGVIARQLRPPSPGPGQAGPVRAQPLDGVTSCAASTVLSASPIIGGAAGERTGAAPGAVVVGAVVPVGLVVGGTTVVGDEGGTVTAG
jgi:hypothetical protein